MAKLTEPRPTRSRVVYQNKMVNWPKLDGVLLNEIFWLIFDIQDKAAHPRVSFKISPGLKLLAVRRTPGFASP